MLYIAIALVFVLLVASGIGYYVCSWLYVEPIGLSTEEMDATDETLVADVSRWLDRQFEQNKFNGGVLLVSRGNVLLSKTCGFVDHTATQPLNNHSAFRLASLSKQFTAAGVLRLAELKLIEFDETISSHIPGFKFDQVTVRHLLNQTSGIADNYLQLAAKHQKEFGDVLTISNVVDLISRKGKMLQPPGEVMKYSNTNYVLLAGVVEAAAGSSFEQFMSKEVFQPLGMKETRVGNLLSNGRSPNQAGDFEQTDEKRVLIETTWVDGVAGDGGVFCSLHDFVIWDEFWRGSSIVSDELLSQSFEKSVLRNGQLGNYGFGWVVEQDRHWHNGAWLGANSYIVRYPKSQCCLVVLDNSANLRLDKIARRIEGAFQPILKSSF